MSIFLIFCSFIIYSGILNTNKGNAMNNKMKVLAVLTGLMLAGQASASEIKSEPQKDGSTKITVESTKLKGMDPVQVEYTISQDSPFNQVATQYDVKVYKVENDGSQVSKSGVYDNNSSLLKLGSEPKTMAKTVSTHKDPLATVSVGNETTYVKSVSRRVDFDKEIGSFTVVPGIVKSGFDFAAFPVGKDIYNVHLSQDELLGIQDFKAGEDAIGLPSVSSWSAANVVYLPEGKTARFDSPSFTVDGKSYKNVYLISAKK